MPDLTKKYSLNEAYPVYLPNRIRLSDGTTKTDRTTFTDADLTDAGYTGPYEVEPSEEDFSNRRKNISFNTTDGWVVTWKSYDELSAILNNEKQYILSETDWTQLPDADLTEEKKAEYTTYRQAVRDYVTNATTEDLRNPTWPTKPSE